MSLPRCKFWEKCYRKNPDHLKQFQHPGKKEESNANENQKAKEQKQQVSERTEEPTEYDRTSTALDKLRRKDETNEQISLSSSPGLEQLSLPPPLSSEDDDDDEDPQSKKRDKKRRASVSEDDDVKRKKIKLLDGGKEKERKPETKEKNGTKENERPGSSSSLSKDDEDDDDDDDFLTIVSTGTAMTPKNGGEERNLPEEDGDDQEAMPETLKKPQQYLQSKYSMEFPADLFDLWNFCCARSPLNPTKALTDAGLILVGPFDVLAARRNGTMVSSDVDIHLHWRFFYDPPEMTTVLSVTANDAAEYEELEGLHYGYFRDDPKELPTFLVSSSNAKGCVLSRSGSNLFAVAIAHVNRMSKVLVGADASSKRRKTRMKELVVDLIKAATAAAMVVDAKVKTEAEKRREKRVVAKPFRGVGMVVPFDKKTEVGYRELPETNSDLKKMFSKWCDAPPSSSATSSSNATEDESSLLFAPIQEILTFVQFANDECDYGMGLEMGIDIFAFGHSKFQPVLLSVLPLAYKLLDRLLFSQIAESHVKNRTDSSVPKLF